MWRVKKHKKKKKKKNKEEEEEEPLTYHKDHTFYFIHEFGFSCVRNRLYQNLKIS